MRSDCLSIAGLAREVVVLTGAKATTPKIKTVAAAKKKSKVPKFKITLLAKKDCPHYVGRIIRNIDPQAVTPIWLKERLRRSGIRSIHPVVDVTNYVMLELGQPMHAFDLAKVEGEIRIRSAQKGETLALLDGKSVNVIPGTLVIADKTRALALAGVMGGAASAVTDDTSAIFLESAYFKPTTISAYARQYGLHSESSHRFERGVDPELQVRAMQRATALLLEICGGDADTIIELTSIPDLPKRGTIVLRGTRIAQLLGFTIPQKQIEMILRGLGMRATKTAHGWRVVPPSHRFDITRECDLIEELARVYGYDKVPSQLPQFAISSEVMPETHIPENRLRQALIDRDYQEVITYSFIDPELQALLDPNVKPMILTNPIASNMAAMRTSLWPGLLQALLYNQNRQQTRLRLFELGRAFLPGTRNKLDDLSQEKRLAGAICGQRYPKQWGMDPENVDFYDLKADIDALLSLGGGAGEVQFVSTSHPALHPSQSAEIQLNGRPMGIMGRAHPQIQRQLGLESPIFLFELLSSAIQMAKVPIFRELSKFPSIRRDLTISVNRQLPAKTVMECASHAAGGLLVNLEIFADYRGEGIDSGRKNLSLSLTLQDSSRTLKDEIVETIMTKVVTALQTQVGAQLRQ